MSYITYKCMKMKKIIIFNQNATATICTLFTLIFSSLNFAQGVKLESHKKMNVDGLHFWYSDPKQPVAIYNRNITPKGDCLKVVNGYVFFTWYKGGMKDRNLMVSRRKIGSDSWVTIEFPDKNTLFTGINQGTNYANDPVGDSHRTTSVGVSQKDGTIHLAYDTHSGEMNFRMSKKDIAFGPDSEFVLSNFNDRQNYLKPGEEIKSFTYPNFSMNNDGELMLNYRIGGTRRGNLMMAYYDGKSWSTSYKVVNGRDPDPTFNLYGELKYQYGKMYLGGSVRIMNSPIEFNQGFYFAIGGQRGNEPWKTTAGATNPIPLTTMAPYKVAEPLPSNSEGMTSVPSFAVTEKGAVHFVNRVSGEGIVHYYKPAGSNTFVKGKGGASDITFAAGGRVYGVELAGGNIVVRSTPENESNWKTDFTYNAPESFGTMEQQYYQGKLYIIANEEKESDKRPLHHIVINLGNTLAVDDFNLSDSNAFLMTPNPAKNIATINDVPENTEIRVKRPKKQKV
jgi:hypothetical protein